MTKPVDNPVSDAQSPEPSPRKPYEKPVLQVYGDLAEIVKSISGSKMNDGAGHPNKHFTS